MTSLLFLQVMCLSVAVANVEQPKNEIELNVQLAANFLASLLKKNWQNIKVRLFVVIILLAMYPDCVLSRRTKFPLCALALLRPVICRRVDARFVLHRHDPVLQAWSSGLKLALLSGNECRVFLSNRTRRLCRMQPWTSVPHCCNTFISVVHSNDRCYDC